MEKVDRSCNIFYYEHLLHGHGRRFRIEGVRLPLQHHVPRLLYPGDPAADRILRPFVHRDWLVSNPHLL